MKGVLAAALVLVPAAAIACPACATREDAGLGMLALVGIMIAVPYVVAAVALRVIRRLAKDDR